MPESSHPRQQKVALVFLAVGAISFGFSGVLIKLCAFPAPVIASFRMILAGLAVAPLCLGQLKDLFRKRGASGVLLLLMLRLKIIDEECISDRDATPTQIILGLIAVLIIFVFCNYVFKLYWAITFSICIVYTTSFDRALQNVFPSLSAREDKKA